MKGGTKTEAEGENLDVRFEIFSFVFSAGKKKSRVSFCFLRLCGGG